MILNVISNNKILKDKIGITLPDFTVLTGENGSGKTQLLVNIEDNLQGYWMKRDNDVMENPEQEIQMIFPLQNEDGTALTEIVYSSPGIKNSDSTYEGQRPLTESIRAQWGIIQPIAKCYHLMSGRSYLGDNDELAALNLAIEEFIRSIVINPTTFSNTAIKKATLEQLKQLKDLSSKSGKKIGQLTYLDFLMFYEIPTQLFSSAIDLLFHQFDLKSKYYPHLTSGITPPWKVFNDILAEANFKYVVDYYSSPNEEYPQLLTLNDIELGLAGATLNVLSSGEKTIIALIFVLYHSSSNGKFPQVILFDEPDAHLHPSLTQLFLKVITEVLVKKEKVKVIITTHSPSTIALSPSESVFKMDRLLGYPVKESIQNAVNLLTNGLNSVTIEESHLGIAYNIKAADKNVLFTEGITDKIILEAAWKKLYTGEMPFYIQDCFSAGFMGQLFGQGDQKPDGIFKQFPGKKMIALFDFDQSGYQNWNNKKKFPCELEDDPTKCLVRSNESNGFVMLLPVSKVQEIEKLAVISGKKTYKEKSSLTIESLFLGQEGIKNSYFSEEPTPGSGSLYVFTGDKRDFAKFIKDQGREFFIEFEPLFDKILLLMK